MTGGVDIPTGLLLAGGHTGAHLLLYHGGAILEGERVPASHSKSQGRTSAAPIMRVRCKRGQWFTLGLCHTSPSSCVLCSLASPAARKGAPSPQLADDCKASTHFHQPPLQGRRWPTPNARDRQLNSSASVYQSALMPQALVPSNQGTEDTADCRQPPRAGIFNTSPLGHPWYQAPGCREVVSISPHVHSPVTPFL